MRLTFLSALLLVMAAIPPHAPAVELTPFTVRNLAPPALVQSIAAAEPARLIPPGRLAIRFSLGLANNASINQDAGEQVTLDGETLVTTLGLRYGLTNRLQVGLEVPWIHHGPGNFDGFIRDWHDFFGLPNGDRNHLPEDQLDYSFAADNGGRLLLTEATDSLGDIRLLVAWQWLVDASRAASLHAAVKLPSGNDEDLTGNQAWNTSLGISAQQEFALARGEAAVWGGLAATWLGNGEVLPGRAEDWAINGWAGMGWSPLDWLAFKLQADSHSALYESNLGELGDPALLLTMGGTLGFGERTTLDIGVGEDLFVNASPDVTLHMSLVHRF